MRSASAAEWVLSLVTPPDRAASTVGDLLEQSSARGVLWFWSSVLRTACSHFWRDLSGSPRQMVYLAFWGFLMYIAVGLSFAFITPKFFYLPAPAYAIILRTAVPFLVGWLLAGRSDGRELAAVFSVVALKAVWVWFVLYVTWFGPLPEHVFTQFCAVTLSMAAGAILFRREAIKGATHA